MPNNKMAPMPHSDMRIQREQGGVQTMNDRERRDFEAGLSAEVDAWLRGENTRREFIKKFGLMTGMLAASGGILSPWVDRALV